MKIVSFSTAFFDVVMFIALPCSPGDVPRTCIRISLGTYAVPQIHKPLKTKLSAMNYFVSFIAKSFFREKKTKEKQGGIKEERKKYKEEKREIAQ